MNSEQDFYLPDGSRVFLKSEKNNIERLICLAESKDTANEIDIMKKIGNFPPFSLLVYDKFLGWGNYHQKNGRVFLTIIDYSDSLFADWIDCSFSFNKSSVRVIKKMGDSEEFLRRVEIRKKFPWIDYNSVTQIMQENMTKGCSVQKELDLDYSDPPRKDMYSLFEDDGEILVNHLIIEEFPGKGEGEFKFSCGGEMKKYSMSYGAVEEMILSQNPDALIAREPLLCCSRNILNSSTCIQDLFLKDYLKKRNLKKINPKEGLPPILSN